MITKTLVIGTLAGEFSWSDFRGLHDSINAAEPANQENIRCSIVGDALIVTVRRPLTPAEEVIELRRQHDEFMAQIRELIGNARTDAGRGLGPDRADAIRKLVGAGDDLPIGTPAKPAPTAVAYDTKPLPAEDLRAAWLEHLKQGGWKLPGDEIAVHAAGKLFGLTADEILNWTPNSGTIAQVLADRGIAL